MPMYYFPLLSKDFNYVIWEKWMDWVACLHEKNKDGGLWIGIELEFYYFI